MKMKNLLTPCSILSMLAFCAAPPAIAMMTNEDDSDSTRPVGISSQAPQPQQEKECPHFIFSNSDQLNDIITLGHGKSIKLSISGPISGAEVRQILESPLVEELDFDMVGKNEDSIMGSLEDALSRNITLRVLRLRGTPSSPIKDEIADAIGKGLARNTGLRTLILETHGFSPTAVASIAFGLRRNITLEVLSLNECEGNIGIRDEGVLVIAEALEANPDTALRDLNLYHNYIGKGAAGALEKLFASNATLQNVNLAYNPIEDEGAWAIREGLRQNTSIQSLDLSNIRISSAGVRSLMTALTQNKDIPLHTLSLRYNTLEVEGARAIGTFLATSHTLRVLDLNNTNMTDRMAMIIGAGITLNNNSLEILDFRNPITTEGVRSLLAALTINSSVREITVWGSDVDAFINDPNRSKLNIEKH